jgi:hypothetical protein
MTNNETMTQSNVAHDLAERMTLRKRNAGLIVGTHTSIVGQTLSDIAPLMTQAVSALTVGYATYEGVQKHFDAPWWLSIVVGVIAAIAVEAVGFVAVSERDKAQSHNQRTPDESLHMDLRKANGYVVGSFLVTVAIVATFESVPSLIRLWNGQAALGEVLFRCGLLVFPFLSRLGSNLFAFRSVREQVDHSEGDVELRDLELSLRKEEMRAKYAAKVAKFTPKPTMPQVVNFTQPSSGRPVKFDSADSESFTPEESQDITAPKVLKRRATLLDILGEMDGQESDALNKSDLARRLNVSRPTLLSDIEALKDSGKLSLNGHIRVK